MAQDNVTKIVGLVTQYNPLAVASGALVVANDAVCRREGTVESRRGYSLYSTFSAAPSALFNYLGRILTQFSNKVAYDDGSGTPANYSGTYLPPSGQQMRGIEASSNIYLTTSTGVEVFMDVAGTAARLAGAPRCLDPAYTLPGAGAGFLTNGNQCAYRGLIKRIDQNQNTIFGYPSQRMWVTNTGASPDNVTITTVLPTECVAGDIFQMYRTPQQVGTTDDISGDEEGLVYQQTLSSSDISAKLVTFTDVVTDALIGASLYTNPSQEGIAQANDRPPLCNDLAFYKSAYLFFGNTKTKQRLFFSQVSASNLTGNTLTLSGVTYNFGSTEILTGAGAPQVAVSATGVLAADIDLTARSFVRVINRYAGNTSIYAYYVSGPDDPPGQIQLEERGVGASAFTMQSSNTSIAGSFFPQPPVSPATNTDSTSTNSINKNYIFYSKSQQPEAVPALNYIPVGPANKAILRVQALRDSLIIISEDGVYRLTGESPESFSVVALDRTVYCRAPESVATLANQVFMLSNQGVVAISDTGVQVISRDIEPLILPLLISTNLKTTTVGFSYQSERIYGISLVSSPADSTANQTYIYNVFTKAWTRWRFAVSAAIVEQDTDLLYLAKPEFVNLYKERKAFDVTDYADPESSVTLSNISGSTCTLTISGGAIPSAGWVLAQSGSQLVITAAVSSSVGVYTITTEFPFPSTWTTGDAILYPSIDFEVTWAAWHASQPAMLKHVRQVEFLTDNIGTNNAITQLSGTFVTDLDQAQETVPINSGAYRWGSSQWGNFPFGGQSDTYAYPLWTPKNKGYGRIFNFGVRHNRAFEKITLNGISYTFDMISERTSK